MRWPVPCVSLWVLCAPLLAGAAGEIAAEDLAVAVRVADEFEDAGRDELFRMQLAALVELVGSPEADPLRFRACGSLERQRRLDEAGACFASAAALSVDLEIRALCRYREGALLGRDGPTQAARDALEQLALDSSGTDAARRATRVSRGWRREEMGPGAEADWLLGIASQMRARGLGDGHPLLAEVLVEAGRIRLTELGAVERAARTLQQADAAARGTSWGDDAWIWRARALRGLGRFEDALSLLDALIASQESSWMVGSYDSPHRDDALFERGLILLELGRRDTGLAALDALAEQAPHSRLLDDAAFAAARARWQTGEGEALRRFIDTHPDSRLVVEAQRLIGDAR